jgi:uncharacterized membrane protein YagU involved in acid resistance
MNSATGRAILGGVVATIVMTLVVYFVAPIILGHSMDVAGMLARGLGVPWFAGMLVHLVNGIVVFPLIYALVVSRVLPGPAWVRGTIWGMVLWFVLEALVMPMMGVGFFSANAGGSPAVVAALLAHVVYGALLGRITG